MLKLSTPQEFPGVLQGFETQSGGGAGNRREESHWESAEDPSSERALLYRGKLLSRTNRYQEALVDFNELLAANPQHRDAQAEVRHLKSKT